MAPADHGMVEALRDSYRFRYREPCLLPGHKVIALWGVPCPTNGSRTATGRRSGSCVASIQGSRYSGMLLWAWFDSLSLFDQLVIGTCIAALLSGVYKAGYKHGFAAGAAATRTRWKIPWP
jgi:hypothetical protein